MAAEEGTVHHEDTEWDAQKENFTRFYKTENRTLKDAARCMVEFYDFSATPRQWERKVKVWGLEKYTSRQDRLKQIESQGRSIHEVARAGRRPRAYDPGLLHPEHGTSDDRNIRRFARREMNRSGSRSRSRSRSNSFGNRSRSASPMPDDQPIPEEILNEDMYDLDFGNVLQAGSIHAGPMQVPAVPTDHDSFGAQAHVLQLQNPLTGEVSDDLILSLPEQGANHSMMHNNDALAYNQYQFADLDRRYSLEVTRPQQIELEQTTLFPALDTSFESQNDFIHPPAETMDDISPTVKIAQNSAWMSQPPYGSQGTVSAPDYSQGSLSQSQSYHATPITENGPMPNFQGSIEGMHTPTMVVPELVFPPSSPSPAHFNLPAADLNVVSSSDQHIFADFHASVSRYSQAVINAVHSSASSGDARSQVLKRLEDDLNFESRYSLFSRDQC